MCGQGGRPTGFKGWVVSILKRDTVPFTDRDWARCKNTLTCPFGRGAKGAVPAQRGSLCLPALCSPEAPVHAAGYPASRAQKALPLLATRRLHLGGNERELCSADWQISWAYRLAASAALCLRDPPQSVGPFSACPPNALVIITCRRLGVVTCQSVSLLQTRNHGLIGIAQVA
jgi:hypothetical protein